MLQTLGMTKRQLVQLIKKQIAVVGVTGIIAGIILGVTISLTLIPHVIKVLGISLGNTGVHFYPEVQAIEKQQ